MAVLQAKNEDGQWPSLHCSFRICFGIHGRIIFVPYKHFIIFVWLSEDAQRAPLLLINVVFVIVLLYGNDVGTAIGRPLTKNRQIVGDGALNTCPSPLSLRDISPHCGASPDSPIFYDNI